MNFYRTELLWHAWTIHACLADFGAEASMDLASFVLEVRARNRYYKLHPRFVVREGAELRYVQRPANNMRAFGGWLPYVNKRWPIGSGKFAFKDFCLQAGLPTPRLWRNPDAGMRDFLVKHDLSSSGSGMRGPFQTYDAADARQRLLDERYYYEQFVRGRMVKAWFWEDRLVNIEMPDMPKVTGDGENTVRRLLERAKRNMTQIGDWDKLEDIARYQGLSLDTVLPKGEPALADFRYASPLVQAYFDDSRSLERYRDSPVVAQLRSFAPALWQGIPEAQRRAALYVVDAIADAQEKIWLLEMNCNPMVHPEVYPPMLESLFGPRGQLDAAQLEALPPAPSASALPLQALLPGHPGMPGQRPPGRWVS